MAGQFRGYEKPTEVNKVSADTGNITFAFSLYKFWLSTKQTCEIYSPFARGDHLQFPP